MCTAQIYLRTKEGNAHCIEKHEERDNRKYDCNCDQNSFKLNLLVLLLNESVSILDEFSSVAQFHFYDVLTNGVHQSFKILSIYQTNFYVFGSDGIGIILGLLVTDLPLFRSVIVRYSLIGR